MNFTTIGLMHLLNFEGKLAYRPLSSPYITGDQRKSIKSIFKNICC